MNAIEEGEFRRGWAEVARTIPQPAAILCISAHWETRGVAVTEAERPGTIHDFDGFPRALFEARYPAPGDPMLAREVVRLLSPEPVRLDPGRGLDHGCWSVLMAMYPQADVPVVQLSLDTSQPAAWHLALAARLAPLREHGVLILGSGDIVHNLGAADFRRADGYDWALRFNEEVKRRIAQRDHEPLMAYEALGPDAALAVPTPEHYLPLLYALANRSETDEFAFFNDRIVLGSISMTSVLIG